MANPALSLNQLDQREGRCRTHLSRLLRIAWLSPMIVDAIASGTQPRKRNRQTLLTTSLPIDWSEQERMFAIAT
jgi:site-specific DNA recombinase